MALKNIFNILVDLKIVRSINQPLVTQNDSVVFILEVMDNGVPFDLTDTTTISLAHTRKDGTVVVTPGTKVGNIATFELGTNETAVAGGVIAKAQFYGADGRVSTLSFGYQVGLDPTGSGYVPSASEATLIEVVLNDGPLIIQSAEEAAAYANEQGDYALQVGTDNETRYLNAVSSVALRDSTYPNPSHGDTVRITELGRTDRYVLGAGWVTTDVYNPIVIDELSSQLADKSKESLHNEVYQTYLRPSTKVEPRNMVTFYFDDGPIGDYNIIRPIAIEKNIPVSIGIISSAINGVNSLSAAQIVELYNLGWGIDSHTHSHPSDLKLLTDAQLDFEFGESKRLIEALGVKCHGTIYPVGMHDSRVDRIALKHFKYGLSSYEFKNKVPINNGAIRRIMLDTRTLDQLKVLVDGMNKEYIVFYSHATSEFNATQQQKFKDIIDYVKSKNIEIVTVNDAFKVFGNVLEISNEAGTATHFAVDQNGQIQSEQLNSFSQIKINPVATPVTNTTPISFFKQGMITVASFYAGQMSIADRIPFASGGGTLITNRLNSSDAYSYQEFFPYDNSTYAIRVWDNTNSIWKPWIEYSNKTYIDASDKVVFKSMNAYTAASLHTDFPARKITVFDSNATNSAGFPGVGYGTCTTYTGEDKGWSYQEFRIFNSWDKYIRYVDSSTGAWSAWKKFSVV